MQVTRNEDSVIVNTTIKSRKSRFLRALGGAGLSQAAWARENGITPAHLSLVLNGHRESDTLTGKLEDFIRERRNKAASAEKVA